MKTYTYMRIYVNTESYAHFARSAGVAKFLDLGVRCVLASLSETRAGLYPATFSGKGDQCGQLVRIIFERFVGKTVVLTGTSRPRGAASAASQKKKGNSEFKKGDI
jgi:hypothetical protein